MLCRDVAQELHRKAGVVFDDAIDFLNRFTLGPELDRAELQTFHENIAGTRRNAADVDPMDVDREKTDQRAVRGSGVDRRVHDRVIQMLALNRRVIAQNHVAALQALATVDGKAVAHGHADRVGDEDGHAAGALRDQLAIGAYESDGEIFVLVDVGTESCARDIRIDLIGDRNDAVADHFEGDGIDGLSASVLVGLFIHAGITTFFSNIFCPPPPVLSPSTGRAREGVLGVTSKYHPDLNFSRQETVSQCHSEPQAKNLLFRKVSEKQMLRGFYPEPHRRTQHDIPVICSLGAGALNANLMQLADLETISRPNYGR